MKLERDDQDDRRTFGQFVADDGTLICQTLELPWRDNQHDISCIPQGSYLCKYQWSPEHGKYLYWVTGVPGRADIEIHIGNFVVPTADHPTPDSKGCILCGTQRDDPAIDFSTAGFDKFMAFCDNVPSFTLDIFDPPSPTRVL